jgi:hypothetical protein
MRTASLKTKSVNRTGRSNSESTLVSGANQLNPAKQMRNRVPPPQRERILEKYIAGKSLKDIGKEESRNRETVARIVHGPEMQQHVRAMRERWFGLAPAAISAVQHALTEQKDGRLGFQLLFSIGVIPTPEERQTLTVSELQTGLNEDARVKKIMADLIEVTIERARLFGFRDEKLEEDLKHVGGQINYASGALEPLGKKPRLQK